jgi:uncharacterized protein YdaU (DUF1376 family)
MAKAWFSMYSGDYLVKTASCSLLEQGAYIKLLLYYHQNDGLPKMQKQCKCNANAEQMHCKTPTNILQDNDTSCTACENFILQMFRIAGAFGDEEQNAVKSILRDFFVWTGDSWKNERMDLELQKALGISETRSRAAKVRYEKDAIKRKVGSKKEEKSSILKTANAVQMHSKSSASVTQSQSQSQSQKPIKEKINQKENQTQNSIPQNLINPFTNQPYIGERDFDGDFEMFDLYAQGVAKYQIAKFKAQSFWEHWESLDWKDTNEKLIGLKMKLTYEFKNFEASGKSAYFGEGPKQDFQSRLRADREELQRDLEKGEKIQHLRIQA